MKADFQSNSFYLSESSFNFKQRGFGKAQSVSLKINENIEKPPQMYLERQKYFQCSAGKKEQKITELDEKNKP